MPAPVAHAAGDIRRRLGIPDDVRRVLVLSESSHWDPNWMMTSEQYFRLGVRRTLDLVLRELDRDPRRVWSADCVFFLAMYWDRVPANRERLAAHINSGRLRLTSSGVTTQDTLLPSTESILRDFLIGQEWLRARGMTQEPRLAYFPDSFGHSPALPSLLNAAGFDQTIVGRIDGSFFIGSDWELPGRFPRPGSSTEAIMRAGSADFVWRDRSGAEVLAHWHPYTYGQGDMLASIGLLRYMSAPIALPDRSERRVAARIERHAAALEKLALTPYLLCPIGLDFVNPIRDLLALCDRYNRKRYPNTGLWVTNAGADDYLDLVDAHRADLPVFELDPNPYWTGFYASRPELKRAHRGLVDTLVAIEAEAVVSGPETAQRTAAAIADAWWTAATANHHDYVTGTSPDRVLRKEQQPWLESARSRADRVAADQAETATSIPRTRLLGGDPVSFVWDGDRLRIDAGQLNAVVDPMRGGCITEVQVDGRRVLNGTGADLIAYHDEGGLWRMGGEYRGGRFSAVARASETPAGVSPSVLANGGVEVVVDSVLDGKEIQRRFVFEPGVPGISVGVSGCAGARRTVTLAFPAPAPIGALLMDQPGGFVLRPPARIFEPTFWPVSSWCVTQGGLQEEGDRAGSRQLALAVEMPRAVAASGRDGVEIVVARNAVKERAFGFLPILACPARGSDPGETHARISVWWPTNPSVAGLHHEARERIADPCRQRCRDATLRFVEIEEVGDAEAPFQVEIMSLKPATRGAGTILRFYDPAAAEGRGIRLRTAVRLAGASLCDARERDLETLAPTPCGEGSEVVLAPRGSITSVRLIPA